jgi:hypothetical protein
VEFFQKRNVNIAQEEAGSTNCDRGRKGKLQEERQTERSKESMRLFNTPLKLT